MIDIDQHQISHEATVREAFRRVNEVAMSPILFVTDREGRCIGSVTDGDLRRFVLSDRELDTSIMELCNRDFHYLNDANNTIAHIRKVKVKRYVPLLDADGRLIRIFDFTKDRSYLPCSALLMAGGKGTRLLPLTADIPKPLLKVGDHSILDITISRLLSYGINDITIAVHHMKDQIMRFVESQHYPATIRFIEETEPCGTLGAMKFMDDWKFDHLLIMNSDLLTNLDFELFMEDTLRHDAAMSVVSIPYKIDIPYAVLEQDGDLLVGLSEKPTYVYQTNAGIYLLRKDARALYDGKLPFDSPEMLELLIEKGARTRAYPFTGYWLDIGKHADFERAQEDVKNLML